MKKIISLLLIAAVTLSMTACRRRITGDSDNVVYETVRQPTPVSMEGQGQQVPDTANLSSEDTKTEIDPEGEHVDETVAAEGGERAENAEDTQSGERITVTLDAMGGTCAVGSVIVHVGGVYGVLPTPTLTGQTFQGWFLKEEGGEPVNAVTVVLDERDHTLYAHWTTKTEFLLTFDPNGGRISPYSAEKTVYSGAVYGQLPTPLRSGYVFLGWFTEPDEGDPVQPTDMVTVIDDTTLYAHWAYDPQSYWTFVLENTAQKVFTCQEATVYLELEARGSTVSYSPFIADTGSQNIAQYEESSLVSDDWVKEKKPNVIIKLTDNMATAPAAKSAMERRFPDERIYVFPMEAVEGTEAEQLYYKLCLAALCYPAYYEDIDMASVAEELGVNAVMLP